MSRLEDLRWLREQLLAAARGDDGHLGDLLRATSREARSHVLTDVLPTMETGVLGRLQRHRANV